MVSHHFVCQLVLLALIWLFIDIRQCVAAIGRQVNTLCQGEAGLRDQLTLFQTYHNFVVPHASSRQPLPVPEVTNGHGSAKVWRPYTPAMAAGLTDHVWTLKAVLMFRGTAVAPATDGLRNGTA